MNSAYLLIPLGVVFLAIAVAAFFWAVDSGQYDDLEEGARAPLEPDEPGN